ncbi:MAG: ABC transporter ATP-binding protein [Leptospiraceae bacterium]|nr:ABC transporter ATP-binding protein [Leptospiraceae bacterium]
MSRNPPDFIASLIDFLQPYKNRVYAAMVYSIINKVLDLMPPVLVGWVIDSLNNSPPRFVYFFIKQGDIWGMAIFLSSLAIIIFGFESLFEWFYKKSFMSIAQDAQHDLRMAAYRHIQNREMSFFDNHRIGDTMAILNDDVNQLERFLNTGFNTLLQLFVLFIFAGYIMFDTSWQLALFGMIPVPMVIFGSFYYQRKISPRYAAVRSSVGALGSRLENNLGGIQVIKSFTAEEQETRRVNEESENYRRKNLHAIQLSALYVPLIRSFVALGFAGVLLLGSYWILQGSGIITIGELVLFSMMIQRLLWPLTTLGTTFDDFERAKASGNRIFSLIQSEIKIRDPQEPQILHNPAGEIEFKNVEFSYQLSENEKKSVEVIKKLSFLIKPKETIGIAGTTGSGKTTLVKLLLRMYEINKGEILIDKTDIRQLTLNDLRKNISLVSQDVYLFYGSIFENIAYGSPDASLNEVIRVAKSAQFHNFVDSLPQKYDTMIGERGLKLSGGQRQRLSIARALLKKAPVLVLDEATSAVDTETERAIQHNLSKITKGRTALIIAHRLSTIRKADRIFVLEKGRLAEAGSHESLLKKNGKYADLWKLQIGES